tara:strand:+ start:19047 stop:20336 length:1290 start_codon:yes stop_codon:yes gene_type:complete
MIFFCSVCVILFFIKGKVKPHDPKGVFVLAAFFYASFGMSGTLDIILGDKVIQEELIYVIIITFIPLIFLGNKKNRFKNPKIKSNSQLRYLKWIKYSTIIIGTLGFFYQIQKLGGLDVFILNPNRVIRNQAVTESGFNFPYILFLQLGYTASLLHNFYKKKSIIRIFINSLILISPLLLFNILEGERSNIFKILLISFFFYTIYFSKEIKYSLKKITLFISLFLIFSVVGNIRSYLNLAVATGDFSWFQKSVQNRNIVDILVPNEPKAVAFTWRYSKQLMDRGDLDFKFGYTYFQSLPYFCPGIVYRYLSIEKNATISDKLGEWYAEEYGIFKRVGFGYLGLAEFYLNFGPVFCIFFFPVFFRLIDFAVLKVKSFNSRNELVFLTSLPLVTFFTHRTSFASVGSGIIWYLLIIFLLTFLYSLIIKIIKQ